MRTFLELRYSQKNQEKLDVYLPDGDGFTTVVYICGKDAKAENLEVTDFAKEIVHA